MTSPRDLILDLHFPLVIIAFCRALLPKLLLCVPGERETAVKQAVAFRHADSLPPLWQVFWMTLMECGWKDKLTLIWMMLLELETNEQMNKGELT